MCNRANHGDIPDIWLKGATCILPFPKKGDVGSASNYRGIILMAVGANIIKLQRYHPDSSGG